MPAVTRLAGWKYTEGTSDERKRQARDSLLKLYTEVAHLVNHGPIAGKNISKLGVHKDFDIAFTVEFKSVEARDEFDPHPLHDKVVADLMPIIADMFVYDLVKDEW
ncbi:unnamed protein product [Peniophora sp. CBMAI 1063]|nr:unnamed protein product [Peniophora sp. CBMAI 1063]